MMMKKIIPIGLAITLLIVTKVVNSEIGIAGLVLAGFIGLGVGMAISEAVFNKKDKSSQEE